MKFEPAEMLVSFTATLPRWKLQPGEMHGHSSEAVISICQNVGQFHSHSSEVEITTCQNMISYTATLLHHPTVGRLVITPTPLSADWLPLQHTLSAAPSAPPPHCRLTGHHSNPTVGQLVTTSTYPVGQLVTLTGHHLHLPCWPPH